MTKYIYYAYDRPSEDDLEHFNFPFKFQFPKIKTPKIKPPSMDGAIKELKKTASNALNSLGKPGVKKDREWKKHKWKDRKRDKNGKWIYDYGDGFPGEKKDFGESGKPEDMFRKYSNRTMMLALDDESNIDDIRKLSMGGKFIDALLSVPLKSGISNILGAVGFKMAYDRNKQAEETKSKSPVDSSTGLHLKRKSTSKEADLEAVNPSYTYPDSGGRMNCYACSVAYDMRRRGYEVTATEDMNGANFKAIKSMYKNADPITVVSDTPETIPTKNGMPYNKGLTKEVYKQMKAEPEGSRGIALVVWAGSGGGHAVSYEIENGKPYIYDAQSGEKLEMSDYTDKSTSYIYFRTDNLEPDMNNVKKVVN